MPLRGIHGAQEDERRTSSVQAKESAEQRLQGKAAMAKSIIDGVDKVRTSQHMPDRYCLDAHW